MRDCSYFAALPGGSGCLSEFMGKELTHLAAYDGREANAEGEKDHADDHVVRAPSQIIGIAHVVLL